MPLLMLMLPFFFDFSACFASAAFRQLFFFLPISIDMFMPLRH